MLSNEKIPINIAIGIDKNYVAHAAAMLRSLIHYNKWASVRLFIVYDGVDDRLKETFQWDFPDLEISWHDLSEHPVLKFSTLLHITRATYLRLAMPEALPQSVNRVLFLDADMVVDGDISQLWNTDLKGAPCAAVVDPGIDPLAFRTKWELVPPGPYFNAGVLLLDLATIRSEGYFQKAIDVLTHHQDKCEYADQDALNVALWGKWLEVSPKWNFQRKFIYNGYSHWSSRVPAFVRPIIIHFTESEKPWKQTEWHPWSWQYLRHLKQTSFFNSVTQTHKVGAEDILRSRMRWHFRRPTFVRGRRRPSA